MPDHLHRFHTTPVLNGVPRIDEMPVWSGDGRGSYANPLFPMYGDRGGIPGGSFSGDGHGRRSAASNNGDEVTIKVNPGPDAHKKAPVAIEDRPAKHGVLNKATSRKQLSTTGPVAGRTGDSPSETWKLIALVVVFLVWVTTASTLLFLYMDRYLFP